MRFSIVIPTYNRKSKLSSAVDSVLSQSSSLLDLEIIVVDDGSTDGTKEWIVETYPDSIVSVISNSRSKGPAGARNTGILAASGQLIAFLDSDDAFMPNHFSDAIRSFDRFPELGLVFGRAAYEHNGQRVDYMGPNFEKKLAKSNTTYSDSELVVFDSGFFYHLLDQGCWFNLSSVVMRAEAARMLMCEELRIAEDYEFWVRLSRKHSFGCLLNEQIRYALHDDNISFETEKDVAANSPQLLLAYEIIRKQVASDSRALRLVERNMAREYFDWGYRARKAGNYSTAFKLHAHSLRHGMAMSNLGAMFKLPFAKLMRQ